MNAQADIFNTIRYYDGIDQAVLEDARNVIEHLRDQVKGLSPENIIEWVEKNIIPNGMDEPVTLDGYQREPLEAQAQKGISEVVITGPEQFGKSLTYQAAMIYKLVFTNDAKMIAYEEKKKAHRINKRQFIPMVKKVDVLGRQLAQSGNKAIGEAVEFSNCTMDFYGAQADFTSNSYRDVAADEYDTWPLTFEKKRSQLDNTRKRRRLYTQKKEGCLVICSSPKGTEDDSPTWLEFAGTVDETGFRRDQSSMGVWHLRCLGCGETAINSTQIDAVRDPNTNKLVGGVRWELSDAGIVVPASIRVLCPVCEYQAVQEQMQEMNDVGEYIHQFPEIMHRRGFNFGGLSCPRALSLHEIAVMRMKVRGCNDFELERTYDNSFRGVAVATTNTADSEREDAILSHCADEPVDPDTFCGLIAGADTQESPWGWYWVVRGVTADRSTHPIACGFAHTKAELETAICTGRYHGRGIDYAIIDQGGTNADDVKQLAAEYAHVWQYKGEGRSDLWRLSKSDKQIKLLNCNAAKLQVMLLRQIYDQNDRTSSYWYLWPQPDVPRSDDKAFDYITNIANVRNTGKGQNSHLRQNWDVKGSRERRDYFDCEKMMMVLPLVFAAQFDQMVTTGLTTDFSMAELQREKRRERQRR